jgi:plasmid stabilization system protein ParE
LDYRLDFTKKALNDLAAIVDYIAEDDEAASSRFGKTLLDHVNLLERFPRMGTPVPRRPGVRKLVHSPILVYYRVSEHRRTIQVLRFLHGARRPPTV